jgi:exonuclease III
MNISKIYSQNVHGIFEGKKDSNGKRVIGKRSYAKLEFVVCKMRSDDIDAYLMQETWDESSWGPIDIGGYSVFHHNNNKKSSRTGVAIVLSPRFTKAWKDAGALDPIQTDKNTTFEGRFIGLKLKFPRLNNKGKHEKQDPWLNILLCSVYHPYNQTSCDFNSVLDSILAKHKDHKIIMGGDMNAQVGHCDCDEFKDVLGPYGPKYRNQKGVDLLHTYQSNGLRIMNTCFEHKHYDSWQSFNALRSTHMLDMIAVSQSMKSEVLDCKTVRDGIRSDHSAL